jgi:hypothetical protein
MNSPDLVDPTTIRKFLELLHTRAAAALSHERRPGVLQLVSMAPDDRGMSVSSFAIGDVDYMVEAAITDARAGRNVFVETRSTRAGRPHERGRGKIESTIGTFAFVIDHDADTGKVGHINGDTTVIETSPGNSHEWLFLFRALSAGDAKPLGDMIRKASGADHCTGVISGCYRLPGTPNLPGAKKVARGRVTVPTKLICISDRLWTPNEIEAVFTTNKAQTADTQPHRKAAGASNAGGRRRGTPRRSAIVKKKIAAKATAEMDRSAQFQSAVSTAVRVGMTPDQLEEMMRQYPGGCAGKYLEGGDRLRSEIDRSWHKADPDHDDHADGGGRGQFGDHLHARQRVGDQFHYQEHAQRDDDHAELGAAGKGIDGAELLDQIYEFLGRFIAYPDRHAQVAHALWCVHTHLLDKFETTPRLAFLSPEPESGKTRALEITELLVPHPVLAVNVSPAYLIRKIATEEGVTVLFDEVDTRCSVSGLRKPTRMSEHY